MEILPSESTHKGKELFPMVFVQELALAVTSPTAVMDIKPDFGGSLLTVLWLWMSCLPTEATFIPQQHSTQASSMHYGVLQIVLVSSRTFTYRRDQRLLRSSLLQHKFQMSTRTQVLWRYCYQIKLFKTQANLEY